MVDNNFLNIDILVFAPRDTKKYSIYRNRIILKKRVEEPYPKNVRTQEPGHNF